MAAIIRRLVKQALRPYLPQASGKVTVPEGVVLVCHPPAATTVPALSPFSLKLETYLRLAKIPHENRFGSKLSSKGKLPWIQINGQEIADSNFCIKFLNEEFNVDLDAKLSARERGISNAVMTMLEENTYWTIVHFRWNDVGLKNVKALFPALPEFAQKVVSTAAQRRVKNCMYGHGIGRHTRDDIYYIGSRDLRAVSAILGDKPFIMGSEPTLVDTAAFGLLGNILWHDVESPQNLLITGELGNLSEYCERMKRLAWPDWDEVVADRRQLMLPAKEGQRKKKKLHE